MTLSGAQEPRGDPRPRHVTVTGGRLPVWEVGRGPSLLLLHGISADHTEWLDVGRRLTGEFRVLAPDLLGRGASRSEPGAMFSLEAEVARLEELLSALDIERPFVAGHSHGASLALALAERFPIAGLLLASPVTPWTRKPALVRLLESGIVVRLVEPVLRICRRPLTRYILTRRVYGEHPPHVDDAVERYAAPYAEPARARVLLRILRDWNPRALEGLAPPPGVAIRVVTGAADRRIAAFDAARWAECLGASFTIVDGAGHGLTEEAPARIATLLRELAAGVDTRTG